MDGNRETINQVWEKIGTELGLPWLELPPWHHFEILESTNQTLWELLEEGAVPGTFITATRQTSGRGQWGRRWQSEPGGLYLSWAIAPNLPTAQAILLTLSSAWGIATLLRRYGFPVAIKWPNDLILRGRKLGGILTETRIHQGIITQAVIGVGLNWANPVPETGITLQEEFYRDGNPGEFSLEHLLALTLRGLVSGLEAIAQNKGAA